MDNKVTAITTEINIVHQSFTWMCVGLIVTGLSSLFVASNEALMNAIYSNSLLYYALIFGELGLVFFLTLRITKMSFETALISFLGYSLLNGITLSAIFVLYTGASIASTFFISALVFGAMAFYGYTTKKDLTTIGNLLIMGLFGVIIASLVNIFLRSDAFSYVLSYITVFVFIGLTAYDTQKIKALSQYSNSNSLGVLGALTLYLDFINIFLSLLRIMGRRRK
jgi:uncharacterized protein